MSMILPIRWLAVIKIPNYRVHSPHFSNIRIFRSTLVFLSLRWRYVQLDTYVKS